MIKCRHPLWFRILCWIVLFTFGGNIVGENVVRAGNIVEPQDIIMPPVGMLMPASPTFSLPTLKAISVDPNDPFKIDFVVDNSDISVSKKVDQEQVNVLVKYFLSFLTLPEEDLWVNLSPYEKDRIIASEFETTNAGRDMLVQDYILKQLASSLTYPDHKIGKVFWKKVLDRARAEYGTSDIPVSSFNKVWVVPDRAVVYEENESAFIFESRLKVLTEEDYLSVQKNSPRSLLSFTKRQKIDRLSSEITREIIVPELEREVNEGKYFAPLRQMYNSLILAIWFKKRYKEHLISKVYVNQKKTFGINLSETQIKEKVYAQYLKAFKKGVYNYIKEEEDPLSNQVVPRKYFSGGFSFADTAMRVAFLPASKLSSIHDQMGTFKRGLYRFTILLNPLGMSKKKLMALMAGAYLMMGGVQEASAAQSGVNLPLQAQLTQKIKDQKASLNKKIHSGEVKLGYVLGESSRIGYLEGKLKKLQNQRITPLPEIVTTASVVNPTTPQIPTVVLVKPANIPTQVLKSNRPIVTKKIPHTTAKLTPSGSPVRAVKPSAQKTAHPQTTRPRDTTPDRVKTSQGDIQQPYTVSNAVVPIPVEDHVLAHNNGIVTGIDLAKKEYKAGEAILFLMDPELNSRIEQLTTEVKIHKKQLSDLKVLYAKQAATLQEITIVQQKVEHSSQRLSKAYQERTSSAVTAPHDFTIKQILVTNGMKVSKGNEILKYYDKQRVRINFKVPTTVNYFGRIESLSINGQPVKSIVSVDWSADPLQRSAQVSLVAILTSSIPLDQEVTLKAVILSPYIENKDLNSILGQAQTITSVREVKQYVVRSPADGLVKFLVREGQKVQAGQVVAVVEHKHYQEEYQSIRLALNAINVQLSQARDSEGMLLITRDKLDGLNIQKKTLSSKLKNLEEIIKRLDIRAPSSGVVSSLFVHESRVFQNQDELLHISTGQALVGDINGISKPILFPRGFNINQGDLIIVETPQGVHLPGRVVAVNQTPYNTAMNLSAFQSLEVMAFDQQAILQPNLPVKVILPKEDKEKQIIIDALMMIEKAGIRSGSAGSPPPPDEEVEQKPYVQFATPVAFALTNQTPVAIPQINSQQPSIDLNKVEELVNGNRLITGEQAIEVLKKKQEESLPRATRFSINGGVWMKDGRLVFGGGLKGMVNNMVGGGVQSGNAIGSAVPVFYQLAGNIIDLVSGKVAKQTALAVQMTQIAYHHMETEVYHQIHEAQNVLIDLGRAEQKITQLKDVLRDLEQARSTMMARESTGFSLRAERDQMEKNVQDIKAELLAFQAKKESLTVALNVFMGQSNSNLHQSVSASLPWGKPFSVISETEEAAMRENLINQASSNSRMKEAVAAGKAVDMTVKLQKLDKLPAFNLSGIYLSDGSGYNPLYNLTSSESLRRTSNLTEGGNSVAQMEIPLFDSVVKTKEGIMALEKQRSDLNIENTKSKLTQELSQVAGNIRSLSVQIQQAQGDYQNAHHIWELKSRQSDVYLPYQLVGERMEVIKLAQRVIDLKAQYFKKEAALRSMGLLGQETSTQRGVIEMVSNSQAAAPTTIAKSLSLGNDKLPFAQPPQEVSDLQDHVLGAGFVNYRAGNDVSGMWALMHNDISGSKVGPLKNMQQILIEDSNIFVRTDALHHFLDEYKNNKEFIPTLKEIMLQSPHADVVWELLKFMGAQEDHGIRFLIEIINQAMMNSNRMLADLGFQELGDVFTMYPQVLQGLVQSQVPLEVANKVLLTFLFREPEGSIGRERLLQSDYWSVDDLARIHHDLSPYKMINLSGLIYDSILRKEALENIDDTFRRGGFEHLGSFVLDRDIITSVEMKVNAQNNRIFLNTSSQWRSMQNYIHPNLYVRAQEAIQNILSLDYRGPSAAPLYNFPVSSTSYNELAYFKNLGMDGQGEYIVKSHNISELARILNLQTPLRGVVLDRLMADPQGRLLVLQAYLNSADPELLQLVEARPWVNTMKADMLEVKESASNLIIRSALEKLYGRTKEEWALNMRLETYSAVELQGIIDPRGDAVRSAQINTEATRVALKVLEEKMHYQPIFWAGQSLQSPEERREIANIQHVLDQEIDPVKANGYVDSRVGIVRDPKAKVMLQDIVSIRDQIAQHMKTNDQSFPKFPALLKSFVISLGLIPLAMVFKKLRNKLWRRNASEDDLIKDLFSKLLDGGKGKDTAMTSLIPPPNRVYNSTENLLRNWHSLVSNWETQGKLSAETILNDFNAILNCAEEVLNDMPYTPDLMWSEGREPAKNDIYQKTFSYFNILAINTLSILKKRLQVNALTSIQRLKLEDDIDVLLDNINYSSRFSRVLSYRGNIEKVMSYKFPEEHWTEKFKLYPLIRTILLYQYLWKKSEKSLMNELPVLLEEGNSLIEGLYENPSELIEESIRLLKTVTERGRTSYDPISRDDRIKFRMRSFYSRSVSLLGLVVTVSTAICLVLGVPGVTVGGLSLLSFLSLGVSYGAYWHPHLDILSMQWNKDMVFLVNKQKKELESLLNPSGIAQAVNKDHDAEIIALARQEGLDQVRRELNLQERASVDMIVIIPQETTSSAGLEQYVQSRRGKLIRKDIPVVVMPSRYQGSGNAYLDALQKTKENFETGTYKQQYPHLQSWEKSRVMFVFHGADASRHDNIQYSLLDLGITNGYRAARSGPSEHKPGHILIYTRDAYFGPIPEFPNLGITMLTSRVNSRVVGGGSLVNARFTSAGQHEVVELLEGIDVNSLQVVGRTMPREGKLLNFLKDNFNLNNASLNQYPVLNGILLIGSDAVNVFAKTASYVETNNLWEKLRLSFSSDFLVPVIMGNVYEEQRETEVREYALKRVRWKDMVGSKSEGPTNIQDEVQSFYSFLYEICGKSIKVNSFLPYSRSEYFVRIAGDSVSEEAVRFEKAISLDVAQLSTASPGGVDLSGARDSIQFSGNPNDSSGQINILLKSFQGFEFQVIQPQAILNPVELFLGSSVEKSGLWFSRRELSMNHDQA